MPTINKELEALSYEDIECISERFLMGWHDLKHEGYNFRVKGLNRRRSEFGLRPLTKEWSFDYQIAYIKSHYMYDEIYQNISDYITKNRVGDTRWTGIEILDCRFGRDYAKAFRKLLGSSEYRKISEKTRVEKLTETQIKEYGGVGVGGSVTYKKMAETKAHELMESMEAFKRGGDLNGKLFGSPSEWAAFDLLMTRFDRKDVFIQYGLHPYDSRYPYPCDFYIKSLDLFIEMHTHYSHGNHWFNKVNPDDMLRVEHLKGSSNAQVRKSIEVWMQKDVEKRETARNSGIHYLVFWDSHHHRDHTRPYGRAWVPDLSDFRLWFFDYDCDYDRFIRDFPENTY